MIFIEYIKEKSIFIFINIIMIFISASVLKGLKVDTYAIIFISILNFSGILIYFLYDFFNRKKYYKELLKNLQKLDKKYFISEVTNEGDFLDSKIFYEVMEECTKSMKDEVADLKRNIDEYKEYIEMWVHEIKTPIASTRLILENNYSDINESLFEEVEKVESYVEQVLFYARSNSVEKDYIIKKINLKNSINSVIKRNAKILIEKKIKIQIDDIERYVFCDSKWIEFILGQIISNSIKYMDKKESIIKFSCSDKGDNIILSISDNGIGISEKEVEKVFEKGYTGENGRRYSKSTGIGLYLCKKLCIKLGLDIQIKSKLDVGTKVNIIYPVSNFNLVNDNI